MVTVCILGTSVVLIGKLSKILIPLADFQTLRILLKIRISAAKALARKSVSFKLGEEEYSAAQETSKYSAAEIKGRTQQSAAEIPPT